MRIAITGINGFIGSALQQRLRELGQDPIGITRQTSPDEAFTILQDADVIFHLAANALTTGSAEDYLGDIELARSIADAMDSTDRKQILIAASSIWATCEGRFQGVPYSDAKRQIEDILLGIADDPAKTVLIFRLTNVFGRKHPKKAGTAVYNFCQGTADGSELQISDPDAMLELIFIDDVVNEFICAMDASGSQSELHSISPSFSISLGDLASTIQEIAQSDAAYSEDTLERRLKESFLSYR